MIIDLDSDLLAEYLLDEYSSHEPRASVAPAPIQRLGKARNLSPTILLHFIHRNSENKYIKIGVQKAKVRIKGI